MAYKDPITGEIVSAKTKKKLTTKLKNSVKSRVGKIVWWIDDNLSLKIGRIKEDREDSCLVVLRGDLGEVEVANKKLRDGNDDDYY